MGVRRGAIAFTSALAVVASILVASGPGARANDFGGTNASCPSVCYHYRAHQDYWYDSSLTQEWEDESDWARQENINPTDMSSSKVGGHGLADIAVFRDDYPESWYGATECWDANGSECEHWHVFFNSTWGPYDQQQKRSLACHEFGHTTGLHERPTHGDNASCMETPHWHTHFNDHDTNHINDYYS